MLHTISESDPNGFKYSYALPNGIEAQATGETKQVGDKIVFVQRGHYQHTAPNGITYIVSYVADETGFHPTVSYNYFSYFLCFSFCINKIMNYHIF